MQRHGEVSGGAEGGSGGQGGLGPLSKISMGTIPIPACRVFDQMAGRNLFLNAAKKFGGVDLNNIWSRMVVVVCKMVVVCEISKSG